jgi:hypothetical protein
VPISKTVGQLPSEFFQLRVLVQVQVVAHGRGVALVEGYFQCHAHAVEAFQSHSPEHFDGQDAVVVDKVVGGGGGEPWHKMFLFRTNLFQTYNICSLQASTILFDKTIYVPYF